MLWCNAASTLAKIRFIVYLLVFMKCLESGDTAKDGLKFIREPLSNVFVQRNQEFRIPCLASGVPRPSVDWSRNNVRVEASEEIRVDGSGSLYFPNGVQDSRNGSHHTGVFRCIVQNTAGVLLSRKVDLRIIYLKNISVRLSPLVAGNIARLECKVSSNQPVSFTWLKNNKTINETADSRITVLSTGVLQIRDYRSSDDGNYSCLAWNKYTEIASTLLEVAARASSNSNLHIYPKKVIDVVLGSQLVIECIQAGSQQHSMVSWTKVLPPGTQATVLASGVNFANLIFENITTAHSGQYLCQTTDGVQQKVTLSVKVPASFTNTMLSSIALKEGKKLTLSCETKGNPTPSVTWFKNGQILVKAARMQFDQNATTHKLTIDKLMLEDKGVYQCQAENELGSSMAHTIVDVEGEMGPPVDVRAYAISATKVNVTWNPPLASKGNSFYAVEYIRVLDKAAHQSITKNIHLAIDHLQPYTEYFIYVKVYINHNIAISSKAVVVRTMEKIPHGPPLNVTLESYSYGSLDITWLPPSRDQRNGNITAYNIVVSKPSDAKMHNITVVKNFYSYTIENLQEGQKYSVVITARTSAGFGPFSEKHSCIISRKPNLEVLPAPNVVTKNINSSILVSVHMPENLGVTGYRISYRNSDKADGNRNDVIDTRVANYYIRNLKTNAEYVIYVTAIGKKSSMARPFISVVATRRELPKLRETPNKPYSNCTPPIPPIGVTCDHANNSTALVLKWRELPFKQPYQVIYHVKYFLADQEMSIPKVVTTKYRNITLSGLLPGNAYDVEISAAHPDCSIFSTATAPDSGKCVLPALIPGSPPGNVTCQMVSPSSIVVDWRPPSKPNGKITEYQIKWLGSNNDRKEGKYRTLGFRDRFSYSLKDVRKDTNFAVVIYAVNSAGVSPAGRCFIDTTNVEVLPTQDPDGQKSDTYDDIKLGIIIGCIISLLFVVFLVFFVLWSNACGCRGEKPLVNTDVETIIPSENQPRNRMFPKQDTVSTEISETSSKQYQILQKYYFEEASKESDRGLGMTPKNSRLCLDSERVPFLEKTQPQDSNNGSFDSQDSGIQGYDKGSSSSSSATVKDKPLTQSKNGIQETVC